MKNLVHVLFILCAMQSFGQKKSNPSTSKKVDYTIPLTPEKWQFQADKVSFEDHNGKKAMKLAPNSGQVVLKDLVFRDGTIEFDIDPSPAEFAESVYFHRKDAKEQEIVYLRMSRVGNKVANQGIQYSPYFDGINMWDMYPDYQAPAMAKAGEWNHVKLIVSGKRLQVFLNNAPRPALDIPELQGSEMEGSIAFEGASHIANVQVKPNETEGLSPLALPDLTDHDGLYLRKWASTAAFDLPVGSELAFQNQAKPELFTDSIAAERAGLVNLTRKHGGNTTRKAIWLKTKISAKEAVKVGLQLGFSDEVWVFLNNQIIFADKNLFQQNMKRYPDGRISVQNATVKLNLDKGENDLLIGVANDFYGWGIMARLEYSEAISETDHITGIVSLAKEIANMDLEPYIGTYSNPEVQFKLSFAKKDNAITVQATGQQPAELRPTGKHAFAYPSAAILFEFSPTDKKVIFRQGSESRVFVKE
ncbi:family 16 glycoside hydrolase [Dyadobacter crusticola]|uniref:family 16 glycoside hydrolase n=1 Tax=Dyadobacter crusticola TaxID=292407 RepID=UPI0006919E53|nr:family 16 glycoside hydrolase [Dyadobacter crusticola]